MTIKKCPDCSGELEQGVNLDYIHGAIFSQRYAKVDTLTKGKQRIMWKMSENDFQNVRRVVTYRCQQCSRLYSYADDEVISQYAISKAQSKAFIGIMVIFLVVMAILSIVAILGSIYHF